jgi:heme oxygenase (biliverdin-IX-beta and delta-forming)
MPASMLLSTLRSATQNAHRNLDQHALLAPLLSPHLTLEAYAASLYALHGVQSVSEATITSALVELNLDYAFQTRLAALEHDLQELHLAPPPLPALAAGTLPPVSEIADLLGYMYVIEGSKLGARMLGRQIASTLPSAPRHYFGDISNPANWANFCAYAEAQCPPTQQTQAVKAAITMFDFYRTHLDTCVLDNRVFNIAAEKPKG